ncbi:hypothetical protein CAT7_04459 [Carnobacterium sp. AT7]|uniref:YcxB family protein n=1 Tax=Carnobacterium sp. AT7 TaxID=333990 RepID=UPI00015F0CE6|nr:YcxB family protein [Carnobacterium sp. AT7]EDP67661.1 hypothetical protein CAT7_04459 [Carnobacterium sp. AT7]
MEIEFELLEEDYINFNLDHANSSASVKKSLILQRILGPLVFLIATLALGTFSEIPVWYWITIFSIMSVIWLVFYPNYFNWEMGRNIKKMLKEGNNKNLLQKRKIFLTDEAIIETSTASETKTPWSDVNKVEETSEYIYIYNSSISAYIIPKRVLGNQNKINTFLEELYKYLPSSMRQ